MTFIKELILGSKLPGGLAQRRGRGEPIDPSEPDGAKSKDYLYDIVSNEDSGMDVDKLDYLLRDRKEAIGNQPELTVDTLFHAAAVRLASFPSQPGRLEPHQRPVIAYRSKAMGEALRVFRLRYDLHETVYSHKVVEGFSLLVTDLLLALDALGPITTAKGRAYHLGETVTEPLAFVQMRDSVIDRYKVKYLEGLDDADDDPTRKARELMHRYENRDPYKLIGERGLAGSCEHFEKPSDLKAAMSARLREYEVHNETKVCIRKMEYGLQKVNPLERMRFFEKTTDINEPALAFSETELSKMVNVPLHPMLLKVRVYYTAGRRTDEQRARMREVEKYVREALDPEVPLFPSSVEGERETAMPFIGSQA